MLEHITVRAIILAAGLGTRLHPLTVDRPKAMLTMLDEPNLHRCIRQLMAHGIHDITVVVGYRAELVLAETGACLHKAIQYVFAPNYQTTGTAESFFLAACARKTDEILIVEGDVVFEDEVLKRLLQSIGSANVAAVAKFKPPLSGTVVHLDNVSIISHVTRGAKPGEFPDAYKTVNLYCFTSAFVSHLCRLYEEIREREPTSYLEDLIRKAVSQNWEIKAVDCTDCKWYEVDDLSDLINARQIFGYSEPEVESHAEISH